MKGFPTTAKDRLCSSPVVAIPTTTDNFALPLTSSSFLGVDALVAVFTRCASRSYILALMAYSWYAEDHSLELSRSLSQQPGIFKPAKSVYTRLAGLKTLSAGVDHHHRSM